jgi:tetrahydromethanopterin S-methyltransferase subunit G
LADPENPVSVSEVSAEDIERINQRLDMLDDRLDNIDTMVSAVAERVMSQLVTLIITCPHCGKDVEVAIIGSQKPRR